MEILGLVIQLRKSDTEQKQAHQFIHQWCACPSYPLTRLKHTLPLAFSPVIVML